MSGLREIVCSFERLVSKKPRMFGRELKWHHICLARLVKLAYGTLARYYVARGIALLRSSFLDVELFVFDDVITRQIAVNQFKPCVIEIRNPEL